VRRKSARNRLHLAAHRRRTSRRFPDLRRSRRRCCGPVPLCLWHITEGRSEVGLNLSGAVYGDSRGAKTCPSQTSIIGAIDVEVRILKSWRRAARSFERQTCLAAYGNQMVNSVDARDNSLTALRSASPQTATVYIIYKTREGTGGAPPGFENAHFHVNRSDDGGLTLDRSWLRGKSPYTAPLKVQTYFTTSFGNIAKAKWHGPAAATPGSPQIRKTATCTPPMCRRDASGFAQDLRRTFHRPGSDVDRRARHRRHAQFSLSRDRGDQAGSGGCAFLLITTMPARLRCSGTTSRTASIMARRGTTTSSRP